MTRTPAPPSEPTHPLLRRRSIDPVTAILTVLFSLLVAPYAALLLGLVWPIGDVLP